MNPVTTPRVHGDRISEEPTWGPREVAITLHIIGTSIDAARNSLDALVGALTGARGRLYHYSDRYLNAYLQGQGDISHVDGSAGNVYAVALSFHCDDPFYYSTSAASDVWSIPAASSSPQTHTITNGGGEVVFPTITIRPTNGTLTRVELTNTSVTPNRTFAYQGVAPVGAVLDDKDLILTSADFTVTNDGVADLNSWKTVAGTASDILWLIAGANAMSLLWTGTATEITVTTAYTNRWI
jgi:phage-related protein